MPPPGRRAAARVRPARRAWALLVDATRGDTGPGIPEAVPVRPRRSGRRARRRGAHRSAWRHLRRRGRAGDGAPAPRGGGELALGAFVADRSGPDLPRLGGTSLPAVAGPLRSATNAPRASSPPPRGAGIAAALMLAARGVGDA